MSVTERESSFLFLGNSIFEIVMSVNVETSIPLLNKILQVHRHKYVCDLPLDQHQLYNRKQQSVFRHSFGSSFEVDILHIFGSETSLALTSFSLKTYEIIWIGM